MLTCYPSAGKRKALKIACAFAEGCGGEIAGTGETRLRPGAAFFYGMTEHTLVLIAQCRREGRDWYYADNAYYFGRGEYFRVTRNAWQHDGRGEADPARFERFGLTIRAWRRGGGHIVLATQSELFYRLQLGLSREAWVAQTLKRIRAASDRPVRVCHKPAAPWPGGPHENVEAALPGAWALVTHSSSVAVKALLEGVPVFCTGPCAALRMGHAELGLLETPRYPEDRAPWLWTLAANQWTRAELSDGTGWRRLQEGSGSREPGAGNQEALSTGHPRA